MTATTLDTNICSYILRRQPQSVLAPLSRLKPESVFISVVVAAELRYGVEKRGSERLSQWLERWLAGFSLRSWTDAASREYASLRAQLEKQGTPIGNMDLLIAAHALAENAVLVTNNEREFSRVPGLRIENWAV
ncbi:type II toxin-antitoxin system tRNA(fMet)-specific endonuclease VapC [Hydrocarboniphaga sp.]|uniref:type II toxin-antitoxin system tRNA(fMet)-specific endonuclease VapC n=1 Tax=Hydrocarboniphaga sp. TaxID=2033016 RepID=UPI003D0F3D1C